MQLRLDEFRARGAGIMAVSVDSVALNRGVAERLDLGFPILSDPGATAAAAFGVLHGGGGPGSRDIARPAIFILDQGVVRWRDLTENWRQRPRPAALLEAVRAVARP